MAMACFLLFTFVPERPLFSVPRLRSCIALSTFLEAASLYFLAAMTSSRWLIAFSMCHESNAGAAPRKSWRSRLRVGIR